MTSTDPLLADIARCALISGCEKCAAQPAVLQGYSPGRGDILAGRVVLVAHRLRRADLDLQEPK